MLSDDEDTLPIALQAAMRRRQAEDSQHGDKPTSKRARQVHKKPAASKPRAAPRVSKPLEPAAPEHLEVIQLLKGYGSETGHNKLSCVLPHEGIRVGSGCSGWGSEMFALAALGVKHCCCFASDIDTGCAALLRALHDHHHFFTDVCSNEFAQQAPACDLLFAGFPCQPFSAAGLRRGMRDPNRGCVIFSLLAYIMTRKPTWFALENVEGLWKFHKDALVLILMVLDSLQDSDGSKLHLGPQFSYFYARIGSVVNRCQFQSKLNNKFRLASR